MIHESAPTAVPQPVSLMKRMVKDGNIEEEPHIFVTFPKSWTTEELHSAFRKFGEIETCSILTTKQTSTKPAVSRGCGFVRFKETAPCKQAISEMHDQIFPGMDKPCVVRLAEQKKGLKPKDTKPRGRTRPAKRAPGPKGSRGKPAVSSVTAKDALVSVPKEGVGSGVQLYISMISEKTTKGDLLVMFNLHGTVVGIEMVKDARDSSATCALVTFQSQSMAVQAVISLNGTVKMPGCPAPMVVRIAGVADMKFLHNVSGGMAKLTYQRNAPGQRGGKGKRGSKGSPTKGGRTNDSGIEASFDANTSSDTSSISSIGSSLGSASDLLILDTIDAGDSDASSIASEGSRRRGRTGRSRRKSRGRRAVPSHTSSPGRDREMAGAIGMQQYSMYGRPMLGLAEVAEGGPGGFMVSPGMHMSPGMQMSPGMHMSPMGISPMAIAPMSPVDMGNFFPDRYGVMETSGYYSPGPFDYYTDYSECGSMSDASTLFPDDASCAASMVGSDYGGIDDARDLPSP